MYCRFLAGSCVEETTMGFPLLVKVVVSEAADCTTVSPLRVTPSDFNWDFEIETVFYGFLFWHAPSRIEKSIFSHFSLCSSLFRISFSTFSWCIQTDVRYSLVQKCRYRKKCEYFNEFFRYWYNFLVLCSQEHACPYENVKTMQLWLYSQKPV